MNWFLSADGRKWLYRVTAVVIPLLVLYGVIDQSSAPLWLAVIAAVLGVASPAMALAHLSPDGPAESIQIPDDLPPAVLDVE